MRGLKQRRGETGDIGPRKRGQPKGGRLAAHHDRLRALNAERPDATLVERREARGVPVSIWTIWWALRELKLSFKKRYARPSKTGRTSPRDGRNGGFGNWGSTRAGSFSSTKRGRRRT